MKGKIFGIIVTYNPDIGLFAENLAAVSGQLSDVAIYDNGSANASLIESAAAAYPTVRFFENGANLGLPKNYNQGIRDGMRGGYDWLLVLDQDTVLPEGYLEYAEKYFDDMSVAVICPFMWEVNAYTAEEIENRKPDEEVTYIRQCISSGSLVRISTAGRLGGFDEAMFIDYVDYDFCRTLTDAGYKVLRLNRRVMRHRIGRSRQVTLLGTRLLIHNHSPERKYHFFRNRVYYARKHRLSVRKNMKWYRGFVVQLVLEFYEAHTAAKLRMSLKGILDGMRMELADPQPIERP